MFHEFRVEQLAPNEWRHTCTICGTVFVKPSPRYIRECSAVRNKPPAAARRLLNFSTAAIAHVAAGSPTCTQAEIDERLAVCHACEEYRPSDDNPAVGVCAKCGCPLNRERKFISKLGWRDQKCPLGKWPDLDQRPPLIFSSGLLANRRR